MEFSLHNTHIKKNASEILETNGNINPVDYKVDNKIQPTIAIKPRITFYAFANATQAILSGPIKQDLFITGIAVCSYPTATGQSSSTAVRFLDENGIAQTFQVNGYSVPDTVTTNGATSVGTLSANFGDRGIRVAKIGDIIECVMTEDSGGTAMVWGYYASDRSGY